MQGRSTMHVLLKRRASLLRGASFREPKTDTSELPSLSSLPRKDCLLHRSRRDVEKAAMVAQSVHDPCVQVREVAFIILVTRKVKLSRANHAYPPPSTKSC